MYNSQITRANKGAFILLLDRSGSMAEQTILNGNVMTKAQALADVVNSLLTELINRCRKERFIGDYFDVAIIGYSGDEATSLLGSGWKSIVDIDSMATDITRHRLVRRLPDGSAYATIVDRRAWIQPAAKGRTPMAKALSSATRLASSWCRKHPLSFPPIVINISDGEATDSSHEQIAQLADKLKAISTSDGNVLLMNIHLSGQYENEECSLRFPSEREALSLGRHAKLLFNISSTLPELYNQEIEEFTGAKPPFRAICYNAPIDELVSLLAIGSLTMDRMI